MRMKTLAAAAFGALALGLAATAADAAPAIGFANPIKAHSGDAGQIEKVTFGWRWHCYWHHGHRYCYWGHRHWRGHHWGHRHGWGPRHSWRYRSMY